jgi:hypothetical protein
MSTQGTHELDYFWTPPPSLSSSEWPGPAIGATNVVTRTKSRTSHFDKTLDKDPAGRDALIALAREFAAGQETWTHDVVIHGIRVRATTNMPHLHDFWVDNWFSIDEWREATGRDAPEEPQVQVYALGGVPGEEEAAYYSRERDTIVFFNTSYYGQLKSWVLGAAGRILADRHGIHSIHGAAVSVGGKGILFIAPTGTGKSTASYGLMRTRGSVFHSDDWVYVRYAVALRDGTRLAPTSLHLADGTTLRGYRILPWLAANHPGESDRIEGLTLDNDERTCAASDVETTVPPTAHAYISEKRFYLRTNLVESFPAVAPELLRSKLENCPDVSEAYLGRHGAYLDRVASELDHRSPCPPEEMRRDLARLMAFGNARAILDASSSCAAMRRTASSCGAWQRRSSSQLCSSARRPRTPSRRPTTPTGRSTTPTSAAALRRRVAWPASARGGRGGCWRESSRRRTRPRASSRSSPCFGRCTVPPPVSSSTPSSRPTRRCRTRRRPSTSLLRC